MISVETELYVYTPVSNQWQPNSNPLYIECIWIYIAFITNLEYICIYFLLFNQECYILVKDLQFTFKYGGALKASWWKKLNRSLFYLFISFRQHKRMQKKVSAAHFAPGCTISAAHWLTRSTVYVFVGKLIKGQWAVIFSRSNQPNAFTYKMYPWLSCTALSVGVNKERHGFPAQGQHSTHTSRE